MQQFVNLWKVAETADRVEYAYGIERESSGLIELNKQSGDVKILRCALDINTFENPGELVDFTKRNLQKVTCENCYPDNLYFA